MGFVGLGRFVLTSGLVLQFLRILKKNAASFAVGSYGLVELTAALTLLSSTPTSTSSLPKEDMIRLEKLEVSF